MKETFDKYDLIWIEIKFSEENRFDIGFNYRGEIFWFYSKVDRKDFASKITYYQNYN